jgi:hypothetical protein
MNQLCIIWGYQEELSSTAGHGEKNSPLAYVVRGLAAELVQHRVAVIMVDTLAAVRAAAAVTTTVPIVFAMGADPVKAGLVESLNRPGGNVTGISTMNLDRGLPPHPLLWPARQRQTRREHRPRP